MPVPAVVPGLATPLAFALPAIGPWLVVGVAAAVAVGAFVHDRRHRQAKQAAMHRLLERWPGWSATAHPVGFPAQQLADLTGSTPRGDRHFGVRYGVGGPLQIPIPHHPAAGRTRQAPDQPPDPIPDPTAGFEAAFFQWYHEERATNRNAQGVTTSSYRERREVVGVVRLPVVCPSPVRIGPESILGRIGFSRGDQQLESEEFNRRFRVEGRDRTLTVQLLDANLQTVLLERFRDRSIDLFGNLLVLGGTPSHRDDSLTGVIGAYPAVREDLVRLVAEIPPQFWRALGLGSGQHTGEHAGEDPADRGASPWNP